MEYSFCTHFYNKHYKGGLQIILQVNMSFRRMLNPKESCAGFLMSVKTSYKLDKLILIKIRARNTSTILEKLKIIHP